MAVKARRWARVKEIVAVVADLKNSTRLGTGRQRASSTASIDEAAVHPLVDILTKFDADDIAIQGDGAVGLFWGERRLERAMCAGITIKTFSEKHLEARLEKKWDDLPPTGFKVGVAASQVLVKRIGKARTRHQEEVWAGKAVNYAAKAAQEADRRQLVVTGSVWDRVEQNDYLAISCGCSSEAPSDAIWADVEISRLPEDDEDRYGRVLNANWCDNCGPHFCEAVLAGKKDRGVEAARQLMQQKMRQNSLAWKAREDRKRRRGLNHLRKAG